jgi:hypothetical protein
MEQEKGKQLGRDIEDVLLDKERLRRESDNEIGLKTQDIDKLKRALDEQVYENENLRRLLNGRQEEISDLH